MLISMKKGNKRKQCLKSNGKAKLIMIYRKLINYSFMKSRFLELVPSKTPV